MQAYPSRQSPPSTTGERARLVSVVNQRHLYWVHILLPPTVERP